MRGPEGTSIAGVPPGTDESGLSPIGVCQHVGVIQVVPQPAEAGRVGISQSLYEDLQTGTTVSLLSCPFLEGICTQERTHLPGASLRSCLPKDRPIEQVVASACTQRGMSE